MTYVFNPAHPPYNAPGDGGESSAMVQQCFADAVKASGPNRVTEIHFSEQHGVSRKMDLIVKNGCPISVYATGRGAGLLQRPEFNGSYPINFSGSGDIRNATVITKEARRGDPSIAVAIYDQAKAGDTCRIRVSDKSGFDRGQMNRVDRVEAGRIYLREPLAFDIDPALTTQFSCLGMSEGLEVDGLTFSGSGYATGLGAMFQYLIAPSVSNITTTGFALKDSVGLNAQIILGGKFSDIEDIRSYNGVKFVWVTDATMVDIRSERAGSRGILLQSCTLSRVSRHTVMNSGSRAWSNYGGAYIIGDTITVRGGGRTGISIADGTADCRLTNLMALDCRESGLWSNGNRNYRNHYDGVVLRGSAPNNVWIAENANPAYSDLGNSIVGLDLGPMPNPMNVRIVRQPDTRVEIL